MLATYVDRLADGERVDLQHVAAAHPDVAAELTEQLRMFQLLGSPRDEGSPPARLGDYELRRELGRGGMGIVYEAWQRSLSRRVALKLLPVGLVSDRKALERFEREAQVAGALRHPHIVSVHGMGTESGVPYYAMELVEGKTLRAAAEELRPAPGASAERASYQRIAELFSGVADGLDHAHRHGVIHRDLKPSNLILDRSTDAEGDGGERLRILDFGLARMEGQESLTLSGDLVGTLPYMSPEQVGATQAPIERVSDLYSFGATLYEILCGEPPFRGRSREETLAAITRRDPRPLRSMDPRVPHDLETIVEKCLRKEPVERYGTAEALAQDLRRFVRGEPVEARPLSGWERRARRLWRHRIVLASVAVALVIALIGLSAGLWVVARQRELARQSEMNALQSEARARQSEANARESLYVGEMRVAHGEWREGNVVGYEDLLAHHVPGDGQSDRRHWEWYYLQGLAEAGHEILDEHEGPVRAVAWSRDGRRLASGGEDGIVRLWDGEPRQTVRKHDAGSAVYALAWHPNERLACGTGDGRLLLWDDPLGAEVPRVLRQPSAPESKGFPVLSVDWSIDGHLAACRADGRVWLWESTLKEEARSFEWPPSPSRSRLRVHFHPKGGRLAVGGTGIGIRDAFRSSFEPAPFSSFHSVAWPLAWSPDGKSLVAGVIGRPPTVFGLDQTGSRGRRLTKHHAYPNAFAWSHDGGLAMARKDGVIKLWNTAADEAKQDLLGHRDAALALAWNPVGHLLASGGEDGTVRIWSTEQDATALVVDGVNSFVSWSPDGNRLAARKTARDETARIVAEKTVVVLDARTGTVLQQLRGEDREGLFWVEGVAWSPEGAHVAATRSDGRLLVWDWESGRELWSREAHEIVFDRKLWNKGAGAVHWHPLRNWVATSGADNTFAVWDAATGEEVTRILCQLDQTIPFNFDWSPDGDLVALCEAQPTIRRTGLWTIVSRLDTPPKKLQLGTITWSPGGGLVAFAGNGGTFGVYRGLDGVTVDDVKGHSDDVRCVSWSPDGRRVATASWDLSVKLWHWDGRKARDVLRLSGHSAGKVNAVAWSPDGRRLASADYATVRIYDAPGWTSPPLDGTPKESGNSP